MKPSCNTNRLNWRERRWKEENEKAWKDDRYRFQVQVLGFLRRRWRKAISKNLNMDMETLLYELSATGSRMYLPVVISVDFRNSRRNSSFLHIPLSLRLTCKKKSEKEIDYESRLSKWWVISLCRNPLDGRTIWRDFTHQMVIYLRMSNVNICHLKMWTRKGWGGHFLTPFWLMFFKIVAFFF